MTHMLMQALLCSLGAGQAFTQHAPYLLQTLPLLGHLHPPFLAIMDEIQVRRAIAHTAGGIIGRQETAVSPPHASGFRRVSATCSRQSLLMCYTLVAQVGVPTSLRPLLLPHLTTSCLDLSTKAVQLFCRACWHGGRNCQYA